MLQPIPAHLYYTRTYTRRPCGGSDREKAVSNGRTVYPRHRLSGPAAQAARAVVVDLTAAERAKDLRLRVRKHRAETVQHHRRRVDRQRRRQLAQHSRHAVVYTTTNATGEFRNV